MAVVLTDRERIMLRKLILSRQAENASGSISFLLRVDLSQDINKEPLEEQLKCDLGDLILQAELIIKDLGTFIRKYKEIL